MTAVADISAREFLAHVLQFIANDAAMGAAYDGWTDEFARKEVRAVWSGERPPTAPDTPHWKDRRVSLDELRAMSRADLHSLGFRRWDEELTLIPIWAVNYIDPEAPLICIDGSVSKRTAEDFDLDTRFGCISYGFKGAAQ